MPQITLEYSACQAHGDWRAVALRIHDAAVDIAGAALSACKTRLVVRDDMVIADGSPDQALVHCEIGLMLGRTPQQKAALSEAVLDILIAGVPDRAVVTQVSAQVIDLGDSYRKTTLG